MIGIEIKMPKFCIRGDGWCGECPMERTWCIQRFAPKDYSMGQAYDDMTNKLPDWCPCTKLGDVVKLKDALHVLERARQEYAAIAKEDESQKGVVKLCERLKKEMRGLKGTVK